ncbi:MAG: hypothetical protein K2H09_05220 [Treponemataceae bacterium]|nr:hypothetical protein [Treponemataceae bacterium]
MRTAAASAFTRRNASAGQAFQRRAHSRYARPLQSGVGCSSGALRAPYRR